MSTLNMKVEPGNEELPCKPLRKLLVHLIIYNKAEQLQRKMLDSLSWCPQGQKWSESANSGMSSVKISIWICGSDEKYLR